MESGEIPGESVTVKLPLGEISQIHGKMGSVSAKTRCDDWKIFRRWLFGRGGFFAVSPSREQQDRIYFKKRSGFGPRTHRGGGYSPYPLPRFFY